MPFGALNGGRFHGNEGENNMGTKSNKELSDRAPALKIDFYIRDN
jgi:hypothetical protein